MMNTYLAVDFGGGSGRVMAAETGRGVPLSKPSGADGKSCVLGFSGSV